MIQRFTMVGVLLTWPAVAAAQNGTVQAAAASITPEDVRHRIGVLAHDSMAGRNTPSREIEVTAQYVAREFARLGLRPGGDAGTFIQRYPLAWTQLDVERSGIRVTGGPTWRFDADLTRRNGFTPAEGITAPVVVVSGQPESPEQLGDLGLDGAIAFVVVPMTAQGGFHPSAGLLLQALSSYDTKAFVLIMRTPEQAWQAALQQQMARNISPAWGERVSVPILDVRDQTAGPLLAAHGFDLAQARAAGGPAMATPLPDLELTLTVVDRAIEQVSAPNTVGIFEGSDPERKNEYIVFSAHMDHVGRAGQPAASCRAAGADSVCNGADDDASGTAAILELAEAYAMLDPRPKRSLIFLTVSGEEKGLWGSDYFAGQPPVPLEQLVANINIDMIGRNWTDTVVVIGKEHSDLGETLNRVNAEHPELNMTAIDDIWPEERFYFRSDHYNFARRGVPALFFFTGVHEDYHRPTDHVEKIDAEKQSRIVKLVFYLGLDLANAGDAPQWNPESYRAIVEGR